MPGAPPVGVAPMPGPPGIPGIAGLVPTGCCWATGCDAVPPPQPATAPNSATHPRNDTQRSHLLRRTMGDPCANSRRAPDPRTGRTGKVAVNIPKSTGTRKRRSMRCRLISGEIWRPYPGRSPWPTWGSRGQRIVPPATDPNREPSRLPRYAEPVSSACRLVCYTASRLAQTIVRGANGFAARPCCRRADGWALVSQQVAEPPGRECRDVDRKPVAADLAKDAAWRSSNPGVRFVRFRAGAAGHF
jgi:hypothetical protein